MVAMINSSWKGGPTRNHGERAFISIYKAAGNCIVLRDSKGISLLSSGIRSTLGWDRKGLCPLSCWGQKIAETTWTQGAKSILTLNSKSSCTMSGKHPGCRKHTWLLASQHPASLLDEGNFLWHSCYASCPPAPLPLFSCSLFCQGRFGSRLGPSSLLMEGPHPHTTWHHYTTAGIEVFDLYLFFCGTFFFLRGS